MHCMECNQIIDGRVRKLPSCRHLYHSDCIVGRQQCPACRISVYPSMGHCPSGVMIIEGIPDTCAGFEHASCGTIVITYHVTGGVQRNYHPNPRSPYGPCTKRALLPENEPGRNLLKRLKCAWKRGLILTIPDAENPILDWSDRITHKTELSGNGPTAFPDVHYLRNCNDQLNSLGIPSPTSCTDDGVLLTSFPAESTNLVGPHIIESFVPLAEPIRYVAPTEIPDGRDAIFPIGTCPSGTMHIELTDEKCEGFEADSDGSIVIYYLFKGGTQQSYHPVPDDIYVGTCRQAFLPRNDQGFRVLKRLKCAFKRGHSFQVATSKTTLAPNSIVWSSIPHKSSTHGGVNAYGFPDVSYLGQCHRELSLLRIPLASHLTEHGDLLPYNQAGITAPHRIQPFAASEAETSFRGVSETVPLSTPLKSLQLAVSWFYSSWKLHHCRETTAINDVFTWLTFPPTIKLVG
uniref:RING-type E3 ubiquitin transferase n=1 Tax=Cyclophora tenuis TaxID=216820 RepID=A0A7S1GLG8_CYCTE